MVTLAPAAPCIGVKLVIRGATVKLVGLVAVPPGVVTVTVPVVALGGTVAVMLVLESTWKLAVAPLNLTAVAPVKAVPLMTTLAPAAPLAGARLVIRGL